MKLCSILLLAVIVNVAGSPLSAQTDTDETILIRIVRLLTTADEGEDAVVHILIKKGRLKLVTQDRIPSSKADIGLDAEEGVLLGNLALGEPASFLILDQDPRENVQILLDTATHARFAIAQGEIARNDLASIGDEEEVKKKTCWHPSSISSSPIVSSSWIGSIYRAPPTVCWFAWF